MTALARAMQSGPRMKRPKQPSDIVTLADLAPQQDVRGGSSRRVFGADAVDTAVDTAKDAKRKPRDLTPKRTGSVKGGRLAANDNITLVRAEPTRTSNRSTSTR